MHMIPLQPLRNQLLATKWEAEHNVCLYILQHVVSDTGIGLLLHDSDDAMLKISTYRPLPIFQSGVP